VKDLWEVIYRNCTLLASAVTIMGLCLCKDNETASNKFCCGCNSTSCPCCFQWGKTRGGEMSGRSGRGISSSMGSHNRGDTVGSDRTTSSAASDSNFLLTHLNPQTIDNYVLETLRLLRTLVGKLV